MPLTQKEERASPLTLNASSACRSESGNTRRPGVRFSYWRGFFFLFHFPFQFFFFPSFFLNLFFPKYFFLDPLKMSRSRLGFASRPRGAAKIFATEIACGIHSRIPSLFHFSQYGKPFSACSPFYSHFGFHLILNDRLIN